MQFCAASPVQKLVPYSESLLSRCGSGAYRYCELYLDLAKSVQEAEAQHDEMPAPAGLRFTGNHLWIDWPEEGPWHIGIDAFLARLIGAPERILYVTPRGEARPAVALTVKQAELQVVFPEVLTITGCNLYLRSNPSRLAADPYTHGWLFEGSGGPGARERVLAGLLTAEEAQGRMKADSERVRNWVEAWHGAACDGGLFEPGLLGALAREEALWLFHQHCSPAAGTGEAKR
jgi:glycine cleavage system H lipoate-binding protein